jgi:biotin carboxylase
MPEPLTLLCIATYVKGQEFMREAKSLGCRVVLLTLEKRRDADWPREILDDIFYIPEDLTLQQMIHAVSYMARTVKIDRIVALDEFDMEPAAELREHMRIPGMGATTLRYFRDKLAMRERAGQSGILVPPFCPVLNYEVLREFTARVAPPWVLKPRSEASAIGIRKLERTGDLWPVLDQLGDRQSYHLLEKFVPGEVFHVDSVVSEGKVVFSEVHQYGRPPMQVSHGGGIFTTRTLDRASPESKKLQSIQADLQRALGLVRGVAHTEFIRAGAIGAEKDESFYFLETSARVGGAYISDVVETATGLNLWREWARVEVQAGNYTLPKVHAEYAGILLTLAKQDTPDLSSYDDPEIVSRPTKSHHAALILKSPDPTRIATLIDAYTPRFLNDFSATAPPPAEKPTD